MEIQQIQSLVLTHQQIQSLQILQFGTYELFEYIRDLALENPLIDPNEMPPGRVDLSSAMPEKMDWQEEYDWQNRVYHQTEQDWDPLLMAADDGGLTETLARVLLRQLSNCSVNQSVFAAAVFLIGCLDEDGYLRTPLTELGRNTAYTEQTLLKAFNLIRSFEPAGVGAKDLSDCLQLQLDRIGYRGPAIEITARYLEMLARGNLRTIAKALEVSLPEIEEAVALIRSLDPRPGAAYPSEQGAYYVRPDIIVDKENGELHARLIYGDREWFSLNASYMDMFHTTEDAEVKQYLGEKLRQARELQHSLEQRRSTLVRCTEEILNCQKRFFLEGESRLVPLRLQDVADHLGLHLSTVSRAINGKYLQCSYGLFPLQFFFPGGASTLADTGISSVSAKALLREIVEQENKKKALSDQKICELMEKRGCSISRRTVAKYRNELGIPGASLRTRE